MEKLRASRRNSAAQNNGTKEPPATRWDGSSSGAVSTCVHAAQLIAMLCDKLREITDRRCNGNCVDRGSREIDNNICCCCCGCCCRQKLRLLCLGWPINKHEAGAVYPVRLERRSHCVEIKRIRGFSRAKTVGSRASLQQQNAVVDARYGVTEHVPNFRRQQCIMHASVTWEKS